MTETTWPAWYLAVMLVSEPGVLTARPSTEVITSPGTSPFALAAVPHSTPRGTPKTVVGALNAAVVNALANPAVRQRLADLAQEIPPRDQQTPEGLAALHKAEIEKWWPIIKEAGIKVE